MSRLVRTLPDSLPEALELGTIAPHVERIRAAAADAFAPNTRRAYRTAWERFAAWADAEGLRALPASPAAVAAYLVARSGAGRSLSTLRMDCQAIRAAHVEVEDPDPTDSKGVRRGSSGASRASGRGRGGIRRPRSPPKRWPRSAPRPPLPARVPPDARVFGLRSGRSVARRLAAMARAAGLEGAFSGHSARVGIARDLVASGASVVAVQIAGWWASVRMRPPTTLGESWPRAGPSPGSTGSEGPPALGSPPQGRRITPNGLRAGERPREEEGRQGVGRGRHPSSLASFGPDRSDHLHVYR